MTDNPYQPPPPVATERPPAPQKERPHWAWYAWIAGLAMPTVTLLLKRTVSIVWVIQQGRPAEPRERIPGLAELDVAGLVLTILLLCVAIASGPGAPKAKGFKATGSLVLAYLMAIVCWVVLQIATAMLF
ncbi:hypothetical protein [Lignipirellula cremea]|uniref:Uncharacterized protein n=1 Tax=Lignipirellula cremea TaxID=2528010 RepID=A0A518E2V1_9BACT|nr:hypothetical protein [Lignipirellula cremea]QDU98416.1 hypothetical protein Pla8534_62840 [Lignipirellula cremea]